MDNPLAGDITTEEEFEAALSELVAVAQNDGVPVQGGWTCEGRNGDLWDVVISQVVPADD
jgi:hypothetical protein